MKYLVFSDSHGDTSYMRRAVLKNKDAEAIFFLGDGLRDIAYDIDGVYGIPVFSVKGNCDVGVSAIYPAVKKTDEIVLEGKKIVFTHGDIYNVKSTTQDLSCLAISRGADIVLFGHTHTPCEIYVPTDSEEYKLAHRDLRDKNALPEGFTEKPYYLFNPGSISYRDGIPTFGIITLTKDRQPLFSHGKLL